MTVFEIKCKITIFYSHISVNIPNWEFAENNNNKHLKQVSPLCPFYSRGVAR